ncbi:hypothetical protein JRQ81_015659 [Phrynocephalus forsythii]|uniref:Uncharacterized protein n=1 Tax=Phrynocephalus forsythii TaxID=171643 RepID=A0A9Q0XUZ8_9SAUR|nr:hypothetical protein JRQ81_015659 [Phrynocephalus forsythii]
MTRSFASWSADGVTPLLTFLPPPPTPNAFISAQEQASGLPPWGTLSCFAGAVISSMPFPHSSHPESHCQDLPGQDQRCPHHSLVAMADVVCSPSTSSLGICPLATLCLPPLQGEGHDSPSRPPAPPSDGLEDSMVISSICVAARKPSTQKSYASKWRRFLHYTRFHSNLMKTHRFRWSSFPPPPKKSGLSMSSLRVFLSEVIAHQTLDSPVAAFFRHPRLKLFL